MRTPHPSTREEARVTAARGSVSPRWPSYLAFAFLLGLQVFCMVRQHPPYFEDDAAFFLRYAENLAGGHGWRWNVEEPPVWGASAPLWPVPIALGVKLGLSAARSSLLWSWIFALSSTVMLGLLVHRLFGALGV